MKYQTLIEAVCDKYDKWPERVGHFNCDPDGEVRGRGAGTCYDFYPDTPIVYSERNEMAGPFGQFFVTVLDFIHHKNSKEKAQ